MTRPVGPGHIKALAHRADRLPEMTRYPKNIFLGATGALNPELVDFGRWLERLLLFARADDLINIVVCSGEF